MDMSLTLRIIAVVFMVLIQYACGNFVFNVTHKFAGKEKQLSELKSHDSFRHARMLANIDLPLGGDSRADSIGFSSSTSQFALSLDRLWYINYTFVALIIVLICCVISVCTSRKSSLDHRQRNTMFKLIQEVIFFGSIVHLVPNVLSKLISVYAFASFLKIWVYFILYHS